MNAFAIFGNPVNHSLSPNIHAMFSLQTGITYPYIKVQAPLNNFEQTLRQFFDKGGLGANITLPFKERAFFLCDQLIERSALAGAVNTIKKLPNDSLLGDNTDGIGLVNDLQRFNLLHRKSRVLLVGAGGAARSAILSLLSYGCKIVLTNRTFLRAQKLVELYRHLGDISVLSLENLSAPDYDLIINATSTGIDGGIPPLSESLITPSVCCYDMFYQRGDTPFIAWCRRHGALYCIDGLGMLVNQAALSFFLWHGILPSILPTLEMLRSKLRV